MADQAPDFGNEDKPGVDSTVAIEDGSGNGNRAEVVIRGDGKKAIATDTAISSVNVPQGRYPFPMSWFRIENTGDENDTITIFVEGTSSDPSTPDSDTLDYTKVFTIQAGEVGDEIALRDRIVSELNAETAFKDAELKAVKAKDRPIVVIRSTKQSTVADFYERSSGTAFTVTPTGNASVFVKWGDFVSRPLETQLDVNPDNPHSLGIFGVTGSFNVLPGSVSNTVELELTQSGGNADMAVDGSVTPVAFSLANNPSYDNTFDYFITEIILDGIDNGVKLKNFMALNSPLTTGITWSVQSDEEIVGDLITIKSTRDIKRFASLGGWELDIEAGGDDVKSTRQYGLTPIVVRAAGTFPTDDTFEVTVNDDLSSVDEFKIILRGFRKEPQ